MSKGQKIMSCDDKLPFTINSLLCNSDCNIVENKMNLSSDHNLDLFERDEIQSTSSNELDFKKDETRVLFNQIEENSQSSTKLNCISSKLTFFQNLNIKNDSLVSKKFVNSLKFLPDSEKNFEKFEKNC